MTKPTQSSRVRGQLLAEKILALGCEFFARTNRDMISRDRHQPICQERQIIMAVIHEMSGLTLGAVGAIFKRDHGTVLHAVRLVPGFGGGPGVSDEDYKVFRHHVIVRLKLKDQNPAIKP